MKQVWLALGVSAVLGIPALQPAQAGDAANGKDLATRWCSSCHDVGTGRPPNDGAPAFEAVARRPGMTRAGLEGWLANPHPPMPKLTLTRREIDDIVSYIETFKPPR